MISTGTNEGLAMQTQGTRHGHYRWLAALTLAVAVMALLLQYVLIVRINMDTIGPAQATLRFFSFFTIVGNLLVALTTGFAVFGPAAPAGSFFARPRVRAGVAVYIAIVCGIYITILRHLWNPQGAQWWADAALHYAVPVLYLAWWVLGVAHGALRWSDVPRWLLFPLAYVVWVLIHGAWLHWYPYPFVDVDVLGATTAGRNIIGMMVLFAVAGSVIVALDRRLGRMWHTNAPA